MKVQATWMRGGTSKCWVFEGEDLRSSARASGMSIDELLLRSFGSPDTRQLDGIGGGTSTTSKAIIVSAYPSDEFDISFKFAQVGIDKAKVDWGSNCGNCSATVGLYAIEHGWVDIADGQTTVRVFNENTGQGIIQLIDTPGGQLPARLTSQMPGSVYPGISVALGFEAPEGKTTGSLYPTGRFVEDIAIEGTTYRVTLIDAGAPSVFVDENSLQLDGGSRGEWEGGIEKQLAVLDRIRRQAAVLMGLVSTPQDADGAIPKIGVVGATVDPGADVRIQMLSMGKRHPAMPVTGSIAVTLAAANPATTVGVVMAEPRDNGVCIDTPSGVFTTFAQHTDGVLMVGTTRTCRTIASATINVPEDPRPTEVA